MRIASYETDDGTLVERCKGADGEFIRVEPYRRSDKAFVIDSLATLNELIKTLRAIEDLVEWDS